MYNNQFGFNPYLQQQRFAAPVQPIEQSTIQPTITPNRTFLNGKSVDSIDVVKATDIPLDGSISYFPLADGSAIVTKQLQNDGTSKMMVYKPVVEQKEEVKYLTQEDMKKAIDGLDLSQIDDLKDDIKDLRQEFKDFKKNIKKEG